MLTHNVCLLRQESFGGTLSNAISGKRIYITQTEYQQIKETGKIIPGLLPELNTDCEEIRICEPKELLEYNFSAPDIIYFELTRNCNLKCSHCLNDSGRPIDNELVHEKRLELLDEFIAFGAQEIRFTGGEPLLVSQIFEYISKVRMSGLRATVGTNGTLINTKIAKCLKDSGLNTAVVSIDGLESRHDAIRGNGTFRKTIEGINLLKSFGIRVRINMVAMKKNLADIPHVVQYAFDREIPIMIRRFILSGRASDSKESLSPEEYLWLCKKLKPLLDDPKKLVRGHLLREDEIIPRINIPFGWCKCKAGRRGVAVMSDGIVYTCGFLPTMGIPSVGNLKSQRLSEVWKALNVSASNCLAVDVEQTRRVV
jgi:Predicted Fe-S oxidoreductases